MRNAVLYVRGVVAGLAADLESDPRGHKLLNLRGSVVNYDRANAITPWAHQLRDCLNVLNHLEKELEKRNAPVLQPSILLRIGHPSAPDKKKVRKQLKKRSKKR